MFSLICKIPIRVQTIRQERSVAFACEISATCWMQDIYSGRLEPQPTSVTECQVTLHTLQSYL